MIWFLTQIGGVAISYLLFLTLYDVLRPSFVPANVEKMKRMDQLPLKYIHLIHATSVSFCGIFYSMGLLSVGMLQMARLWSSGFLLFDMIKILEADNSASNPIAFHHIITVLFMSGFPFNAVIDGALIFFLSEIPVACISYAWLLHFHGQSPHLQKMLNVTALFTYVVFRIIGYPLVFATRMLPNLETHSNLAWMALLIQLPLNVITYYLNFTFLKGFVDNHIVGKAD